MLESFPQELRQGSLVLLGSDGSALGRLLPEEVAELLRRVGMPMSCVQHPLDRVWLDRAARLRELRLDEAAEERRRDDAELHLLGTAPERLVLVGEDALEHVPLAAQVDVSDLGLPLEDRAHELREMAVDVHDLLELVEDECDLPLTLGCKQAGELEEPLERRVHVLDVPAACEAEAERARLGVDRDNRRDPESSEHTQSLLRAEEPRGDVVVDRLGELLGELLLRRRRHQVDLRDEDTRLPEPLRRAPNERRLAVASRSEDDDVLPVADVGEELVELGLPVGERVVEGERAVAERIRCHVAVESSSLR